MVDYRFSGHLRKTSTSPKIPIDITFRTDAINTTDNKFNITQIQIGSQFTDNSDQDPNYLAFFSGYQDPSSNKYVFQLAESTLGHMITFAMNKGLDLRQYAANKKGVYIVTDASHSISIGG